MAVRGVAPAEEKLGRYQTQGSWTDVRDTPYTEDPPEVPGVEMFGPLRTWWVILCSMPHCVLWTESDWQYAVDTAVLKSRFYEGDMPVALLTEIRRREESMGVTHDSRLKLRIRYIPVPEDEAKRIAGGSLTVVNDEHGIEDLESIFDED